MLIISPCLPLSLCMLIFNLRYKLEDDRRAAETSFGTFTVNIYCKLLIKKSLLIFSDHLFYQYRGTLLIARKELKHLPTWGIGIVDGWPLTWHPSWEKRAETLHQGNVEKSRQLPEIRYTPRLFFATFKCNDYKLISRFFFSFCYGVILFFLDIFMFLLISNFITPILISLVVLAIYLALNSAIYSLLIHFEKITQFWLAENRPNFSERYPNTEISEDDRIFSKLFQVSEDRRQYPMRTSVIIPVVNVWSAALISLLLV